MILAQANLDQVPADFFKWFCIMLIGVIVVVIAIYLAFRERRSTTTLASQPVEVNAQVSKSARRFNHELAEQRHGEVSRRLDTHEAEIDSLWNAVRVDIPSMERRLNEAGEDRTGKIHDRINEILGEVRELKGRIVK